MFITIDFVLYPTIQQAEIVPYCLLGLIEIVLFDNRIQSERLDEGVFGPIENQNLESFLLISVSTVQLQIDP